jgi:hypothetical protein
VERVTYVGHTLYTLSADNPADHIPHLLLGEGKNHGTGMFLSRGSTETNLQARFGLLVLIVFGIIITLPDTLTTVPIPKPHLRH